MASAAVVPSNLGKPQSIVIDGALLSVAIEETVKEHVDQKEDGDYQKYDLPAVDEVKVLRLSFKSTPVKPPDRLHSSISGSTHTHSRSTCTHVALQTRHLQD